MSESTRAHRASDRHRPFVVLVRDLARASRGMLFVLRRDALFARAKTRVFRSCLSRGACPSCVGPERYQVALFKNSRAPAACRQN
ncbi:MC149.1R [Molluscum contagiosum virus]|uniref:MC149.1R n=1 Tax=Molluscum contagiosum virus TaxID=10279 RepID=A0A858A547_9POXV|nr:MC149.1 [Molluscum contagiosum virus subtype 1]QHW16891.1 MC149.1R [Molluscum contagiosum virus]AQY17079.1 MC149.1 [Molluscum contagiosum virus subtype 1]AQY17258.1 MC149.1 [Molluscum contagiosum virus subtype 1]AYO88823.1 MC149.1 [Molluscum contagiosum virus subtype 1]